MTQYFGFIDSILQLNSFYASTSFIQHFNFLRIISFTYTWFIQYFDFILSILHFIFSRLHSFYTSTLTIQYFGCVLDYKTLVVKSCSTFNSLCLQFVGLSRALMKFEYHFHEYFKLLSIIHVYEIQKLNCSC